MSTPSKTSAQAVQHSFDGDVKILNSTFDRRMEIRKALTGLQEDLQKMESKPIQVKAEVKFRIGGPEAKEHNYTVTATSNDFDIDDFLRQIPASGTQATENAPSAMKGASSSPAPAGASRQQATPAQSTPRPESRKTDDDVVEIRPFKRQKADEEPSHPRLSLDATKDSYKGPISNEDIMDFLKSWHGEWVRQGGFLYDQLSTYQPFVQTKVAGLETKLEGIQDVLGQSMNTASANTMTELTNISKLIPWLEHCRKTSADKVQAREEKWRTSSATFHDQSRREREAAEKSIEKRLEEQNQLILKIARASGVDVEETEDMNGGGPDGGREESLGAQLTAELNMEAEKGTGTKSGASPEPINIDDD